MAPLLAFLAIVLVSLLLVRLGTNALMLTGMSQSAATFQAASGFFGVGFTTKEAEMIVEHPVRRRIVLHLIVAGNIGLTSALAALIVTFVQEKDQPAMSVLAMIAFLICGVVALAVVLNIPIVRKPLDSVMRFSLRKVGVDRPLDYEMLLRVREGFCVSDVEISKGHKMAGKSLKESRPSEVGIVVLGIYHNGERFEGAPDKDAAINPGDIIMVYGTEEAVQELAEDGG